MPAVAGPWGRALALLVAVSCGYPAAGSAAAGTESSRSPASAAAPAVSLDFASNAPELSRVVRLFPAPDQPETRLALSFYHPLVLRLKYGPAVCGPNGELLLPANRKFTCGLKFALLTNGSFRALVPVAGGNSLTVSLRPGALEETWNWPDGLQLRRVYFQPPGQFAFGLRFVTHNLTGLPLNGLRLSAKINNPEIVPRDAGAPGPREGEDEIFADPRGEIFYMRQAGVLGENWLGLGWGPQGGLISAGEETAEARQGGESQGTETPGLTVNLETPAWDLGAGQFHEAVLWLCWGYDQTTVARNLFELRRKSEYARWEDDRQSRATEGMRFRCQDPNVSYLFESFKAWSGWMSKRDVMGTPYLASPARTEPAEPEEIAAAVGGLVALGRENAVKKHLQGWTGQRLEVEDLAGEVVSMSRYYLFTHDRSWLQDNLLYLEEVLNNLADLDLDADGIPEEVHRAADRDQGCVNYGRESGGKVRIPALTVVAAFRTGAALLEASGDAEGKLTAARYRVLAEQGEKTLDRLLWRPHLGPGGYYALCPRNRETSGKAFRSLVFADAVWLGIGRPEHLKAVLADLWNEPGWRSDQERYRLVPQPDWGSAQGVIAFPQGADIQRTQLILQLGLSRGQDQATAACQRLLTYARGLVLDPKSMGLVPAGAGSRPWAGAELSALNFIELLMTGLGGLEPVPEGLRVHIPKYAQPLGVKIENLKYRRCMIDLEIQDQASSRRRKVRRIRGGRIFCNGKTMPDGGLISEQDLAAGKLKIVIQRRP